MSLFRKSTPTLVLKSFRIDPNATDGVLVDIVGRPQGLFGFLLSAVGIDTTTYLRVLMDRIEFRASSFFGDQISVIPLDAITAVRGGHTKPLGMLVSGTILILLGLPALTVFIGFLMIPIGLVMIVMYFLGKSLNVEVANGGDSFFGLDFKRSVIENIDVDIDRVREARELIYHHVANARTECRGKS